MIFPKIEYGLIERLDKETEDRAKIYETEIKELEDTITQVKAFKLKQLLHK